MKLTKTLFLVVGGVYLLNNPILMDRGYEWGEEHIVNLKQNIVRNTGTIRQTKNNINQNINNVSKNKENTEGTNFKSSTKWQRRNLRVYYDFDSTLDKDYINAWHQAVDNWNSVGVVTLTVVDKKNKANIILQVDDRPDTNQAGVTKNYYMKYIVNGNQRIVGATAIINRYYLDTYLIDGKIHTAEHELGHALGLLHDDEHISVMNSAGSQYGIQQIDIERLKQLYS